ncbi:hypothetical protein L6164_026841 [Bauhinia variegata]|uniref:Uncharacterized protein n=1 Tax=Bauhinia variegata TaxID=167791 RepID=A0ACB9LRZ6_BAUVA|nr:hypothetical protein L6164_026841 [Bauhinia variegata]
MEHIMRLIQKSISSLASTEKISMRALRSSGKGYALCSVTQNAYFYINLPLLCHNTTAPSRKLHNKRRENKREKIKGEKESSRLSKSNISEAVVKEPVLM